MAKNNKEDAASAKCTAKPRASYTPKSAKEDANRLSISALMDQYPVLSAAEEKALVSKKGTSEWPQAKDKLVLHNLKLVSSIARKYDWMDGCSFDDIVSHGVIGLMTAIDRFDPNAGTKLSTYATYWITQEIRNGLLYKRGQVRTPAYLEKMAAKVKRCCADLAREGETSPSDKLLSQCTGIPEDKVHKIRNACTGVMSMDTLISEAGGMQVGDRISSTANVEKEAMEKVTLADVTVAIKKLKPIEQQVVMMRFGFIDGIPMTLEQCAKETGYSTEGCRQIQASAIRKLQADYKERGKL